MKWMIASDIHGSGTYAAQLIEAFCREGAGKLILLGDLLYHGPRNALPDGYDPKAVYELLNAHAARVLSVKGNCDSEVDQMVLDFPIMAEYALMPLHERTVFLTHGHIFGPGNLPKLNAGDALVSGHTHVPTWEKQTGVWLLNPGSVSIPKEGSQRGYMVAEDDRVTWKALGGEAYHTLDLNAPNA